MLRAIASGMAQHAPEKLPELMPVEPWELDDEAFDPRGAWAFWKAGAGPQPE